MRGYLRAAGIEKKGSCHLLRHTVATLMLEGGADIRYVAVGSVNALNKSWIRASMNPATGDGGTCYGDSGGPIFYDNTNMVVALVSWGITPCIGVDYQFRTDTALALDFVRLYLP